MKNAEIEIGGAIATNEQIETTSELMPLAPVIAYKEFKRGCGYRKSGGTYMVDLTPQEVPTEGFPLELSVCPCCNAGIKFSRGFQWIQPRLLFGDESLPERAGLIWIGGKFYPTPKHFVDEARTLGVSRRIATVPRGLVIGETRIYLAHLNAFANSIPTKAGVFAYFVPTKLQYVVHPDDTEAKLYSTQKRGIETISVTPADVMFPDEE
jgi:hypothetical protein